MDLNVLIGKLKGYFVQNRSMFQQIFRITWPAFIELFLSSLFHVVDMAMVGRLSPSAIAAVGLTNTPFMLLTSIFQAVNVGSTALVSWSVGEGNPKRGAQVVKQTVIFNITLATILTIGGIFAAPYIMGFMANDPLTKEYSTEYLTILCYSIPAMGLSMGISAALRGCGQTRLPMLYNLAANFINVVLNYVLIYGHFGITGMGVSGAAWATSISRFISAGAALAVVIFYRGTPVRLHLKTSWKPDFGIIKTMLSIGLPAAGEQLVIQTGLMMFAKIVSSLGVFVYAAHQIVANVNMMAFSINQAFSVSNTALVGRAVGADDFELAQRYTYTNRWLARIASGFVAIMILILARPIMSLYTDVSEVITIGLPLFWFIAVVQFVQASQMSISGALRGSGDTMYPLYATIAGIWGFRVAMCYLLALVMGWGVTGAWTAFLLDQLARTFVVSRRFKSGKWRGMKAKKAERARRHMAKGQ